MSLEYIKNKGRILRQVFSQEEDYDLDVAYEIMVTPEGRVEFHVIECHEGDPAWEELAAFLEEAYGAVLVDNATGQAHFRTRRPLPRAQLEDLLGEAPMEVPGAAPEQQPTPQQGARPLPTRANV